MSDVRTKLRRLSDHLADDIMSLTDEEVLAEAVEDGIDVDAVMEHSREMIETTINRSHSRKG